MNEYILGLDLGQAQDYTALVILETPGNPQSSRGRDDRQYHLRHLERFKLGTPYPDVIARVAGLMITLPLTHANTYLVVDATGVGKPVVDLLREKRLHPIAITITGGNEVTGNDREGYHVPKRDLVSNLAVLFQARRLKIAESLPEAQILVQELLNFKVKINTRTAHDTYEAWREGIHDDLVLAVALACWYGQTRNETELRVHIF